MAKDRRLLEALLGNHYKTAESVKRGSGVKALDHMVRLALEQSSLDLTERGQLYSSIMSNKAVNKNISSSIITQLGRHPSVLKELEDQALWMGTSRGQHFLKQEIPGLVSAPMAPNMPSSVEWGRLSKAQRKKVPAALDDMQKILADNLGIDPKNVTSRVETHVGTFDVMGKTQKAQIRRVEFGFHKFGVQQKLSFDFFTPSRGGFIPQSSYKNIGGWNIGQSVFVTPQAFFANPSMNTKGKWTARHFKGPGAYGQFQKEVFDQVTTKLGEQLKRLPSGTPVKVKENMVKLAMDRYKNEIGRMQGYVGHASLLANAAVSNPFGATGLFENALSRAAFQSQVVAWSDVDRAIGLGSQIPIEIMQEAGYSSTVSSGQAGKLKAVELASNYGLGAASLMEPHVEPFKALSSIVPAPTEKLIPGTQLQRKVGIFQGAIESDLFKPQGVQAVTTFVNDKKLVKNGVNMVLPDGSMLASHGFYKSGAMDMAEVVSYKIKATGPGMGIEGTLGKSIGALISGGEVTFAGGKKRNIKGLVEAGWDWEKALGADPKDLSPGGVPLKQGALIGVEAGTGRQIFAARDPHVDERILNIVKGSTEGEYQIIVGRSVGMSNEAHQQAKVVMTTQTKSAQAGKYEVDMASEQELKHIYEKTTLAVKDSPEYKKGLEKFLASETYQRMSALDDPAIRLLYQTDAMRYSFATGAAKEGAQRLQREIVQMKADNILSELSSGKMLQRIEEAGIEVNELQGKVLSKAKAKGEQYFMQQRLAVLTQVLTEGDAQIEALQNIFAPQSQWGRREIDRINEVFWNWGEKSTPEAYGFSQTKFNEQGQEYKRKLMEKWRKDKTIQYRLNAVLAGNAKQPGGGIGSKIADSTAGIQSLTEFGFKDYGLPLGAGGRGSIEPRFFDALLAMSEEKEGLNKAVAELTGRMTDYGPAIKEVSRAITGDISMVTGAPKKLGKFGRIEDLGKTRLAIDLGINDTLLNEVQAQIDKQTKLGVKAQSIIYAPSDEALSVMGTMTTGAGSEQLKTGRALYQEYGQSVYTALENKNQQQKVQALAKATIDFQVGLTGLLKTQVYGAPGGGAYGAMRGKVAGSAYLPVARIGGFTQQLIEAAAAETEAFPTTVFGKKVGKAEETFMKNMRTVLEKGELISQQTMLSEKAAKDMFSDLLAFHEGDASKLAEIQRMRTAFFDEGSSFVGAKWRHPGIGFESMTGGRMWLERPEWNPASATRHYVGAAEQSFEVTAGEIISKSGKTSSLSKYAVGKEVAVGLMQKLKGDWDGDRINVALITEMEGREGLAKIMKDPGHSFRYAAMRDVAEQSIANLASKTQGLTIGREAAAALSLAGPKQITPQISNTFTEMKFLMAASEGVDVKAKADIFRFLEVAEQVSISSKKMIDNASYNIDLIKKIQGMRERMIQGGTEQKSAIKELFEMYTTTTEGDTAERVKIEARANNAAKTITNEVNFVKMQTDMMKLMQNATNDSELIDIMKLYRRTQSPELDPGKAVKLFQNLSSRLEKIHPGLKQGLLRSGIEGLSQTSGAATARTVAESLNMTIQEAAQAGGRNLPTKGIKGIAAMAAASLLVAGAAGVAMGPSLRRGESGGAHLNSDDLFPDEMESRNVALHSAALSSPQTGLLQSGGYDVNLHLPPGSYNAATWGGRMAHAISALGGNASGRMEFGDHRTSLDALTLSRIRNEII